MADWLTELVEQKRRKAIEDENVRTAPWEGRTRAELIYGRTYNHEDPNWLLQPLSPPAEPATAPKPTPEVAPAEPKKPFDIDKAAKYLRDHAAERPTGFCATHVRKALQHAGLYLPEHPVNARDYGDYLEWAGLSKIDKTDYIPQKGDLVVMQPVVKGKPGHFEMYDGETWISDYVQENDNIYPGWRYRKAKPAYEIYR